MVIVIFDSNFYILHTLQNMTLSRDFLPPFCENYSGFSCRIHRLKEGFHKMTNKMENRIVLLSLGRTYLKETTKGMSDEETYPYLRYLVITNISKITNVIQLIHTATAYDFHPILVASPKIHDVIHPFIHLDYPLLHFATLEECKQMLRNRGIPLIGIEILQEAKSVTTYAFTEKIAIMPGNEGNGLNQRQIDFCDGFVYIPHYGHGTASLNVHVATTLIMNQYHLYHHSIGDGDTETIPSSAVDCSM